VGYFYTYCKQARKRFSKIFYFIFFNVASPVTPTTPVHSHHSTNQ